LTRDIISPVKRSVVGLDEMIKDLERHVVEENLFPLLRPSWQADVLYMVMDEFQNRVRVNGEVRIIDRDLTRDEGRDEMDPVDGRIIEVCDKRSAYIEAKESIRIGIRPAQLEEAAMRLSDQFASRVVAGYDAGRLFGCFR